MGFYKYKTMKEEYLTIGNLNISPPDIDGHFTMYFDIGVDAFKFLTKEDARKIVEFFQKHISNEKQ